MWKHLSPLTKMTSNQATWNWTEEHQKAFEHMKKSISRDTLLLYDNFSKPFVIHTDASKVQLGAVISQDKKPIFQRRTGPSDSSLTSYIYTKVPEINCFPCLILGIYFI